MRLILTLKVPLFVISFEVQPIFRRELRYIGLKWPTAIKAWTKTADSHLGWSQMANSGLLRPVMPPGFQS